MYDNLEEKFSRLSADVIPLNYFIKIYPNLESFQIEGTVIIDLHILNSVEFIELHNVELKLNQENIHFETPSNQIFKCEKLVETKANESVRIYFGKRIEAGLGRIKLEYSGSLNENSQGFYKTGCINRDLSRGYAAVTQFEPNYARRAFPCFDEPAKKATFDIVLVADKKKTVLSNMPLKKLQPYEIEKDMFEFCFERTPIMSTYLVAFIIGEFDYVEQINDIGTIVRVYTPVGKQKMGSFSLDITVKSLKFYTEYFDMGYPLPKLDLIALEEVDIEAMENWGLITFKEPLVLIDQDNFSVQSKAEVALVVAHEVAHQWFGNIVTMEWWTHLWLNEGFATWIEYLSVDYCLKDWDIWSYYAVDHLVRAFELDSLESSHAIEISVGPPSEINQIFDSISYCKGSSVIRMLNAYMGNKEFLKGLQNYLKKFQYKNATTDDLWNELSSASDKDIKELMQNWTKLTGYPLISINKSINENNHVILKLEQRRFFKNADKSKESSNSVWKIPITVKTKSSLPNIHSNFLMDSQQSEIDLGLLDESDYILLNSDYLGFYRCQYSRDMFNDILKALKNSEAMLGSSLDRISILNDVFALTWSNDLLCSDLLELMSLLSRNETNTYVWMVLLKQIQLLNKCLLNTSLFESFTKLVINIYENISLKLGFEIKPDEDDVTRLLHEKILYALAKSDNKDFMLFANKAYSQRLDKKIPADLQKAVFTAILRNADQSVVDEFITMYNECFTPEEKERIVLILAEVKTDDLIQYVLKFSIKETIKKEETVFLLVSMAENSTNKNCLNLLWSFVKENWKYFFSCYSDSVLLGRMLKPIIQNFTTQADLNDVEKFFIENPAPQADQSIKQAIEIIKSKIVWLDNQQNSIQDFLAKSF